MSKHVKRSSIRLLRIILVPLALIGLYQLWSVQQGSPFFPPVQDIWAAFTKTWLGDGFVVNALPSLKNLAIGYIVGSVLGIAGGAFLARWRTIRLAVNPITSFALALPAVALVPLFITAVGIGEQMQQTVIAYSAFVYMLVNTTDGLVRIPSSLVDVNRVFRITGLRRLFLVSLPAIASRLLGTGRATLSLSVLIMVVSEMIGASVGIGAVTLTAQQSFQYDVMWSGMVLIAILGVGLNALYSLAERPILVRSGLAQSRAK